MKLILNPRVEHPKFDKQVPVFNIFYPLTGEDGDVRLQDGWQAFKVVDFRQTKSVALYFHFPFCETICNFCPFARGQFDDRAIIERYLDAIIYEIRRKAQLNALDRLPVRVIFVGGGTPSLLTADEIRKFGDALKSHFDLSGLREFSFECEVKSVNEEKVSALQEIGVTNARFGLQTFDPFWRDMFDLTATVEQIDEACKLFTRYLPRTSFDILYAMNGHTQEQFEADLVKASALGTGLIDVYPVDNVVTQLKLHDKIKKAGLPPLSADMRFEMNMQLKAFMRRHGYLPHNGHGYVKVEQVEIDRNPVVTDRYVFRYHEHVYGCEEFDVVGFGVNAVSILRGKTVTNPINRGSYIRRLLADDVLEAQVGSHSVATDASRGVVTQLPYHGRIKKADVNLDVVPSETRQALEEITEAGLAHETEQEYRLTAEGWMWYVNIMYYLMPASQKKLLNAFIAGQLRQKGRDVTLEQVVFAGNDARRAVA